MPAVGSTPTHVDVGPGTKDDIGLEITSKVQELMRREELHRQLTLAIDDFRKGGAVTTKQRSQLEEVAEEKMRDLLVIRQEARVNLEEARRGHAKGAILEAYYDWLTNECRLDELLYAMFEQGCKDTTKDRVTCGMVGKILRKKPDALEVHVHEIEQLHPWSRALDNKLEDIEERLLRQEDELLIDAGTCSGFKLAPPGARGMAGSSSKTPRPHSRCRSNSAKNTRHCASEDEKKKRRPKQK